MSTPDSITGQPLAYLFLEDGDEIYRVHLDRPRIMIGSGRDNDLRINDDAIKPHHAVIYYAGNHYVLSVVTTHLGVVNGKTVEGNRRLYNGDVIDLEGNVMTFVKVPAVSDTVLQLGVCEAGEQPWFALVNRPLVEVGHTRGSILLPDEFVGSPHFEIENFCAGVQYVVNLDEERGTRLNGVRILQRSRLKDGDVLTVGATEIAVRLHPHTALPAPAEEVPLRELARARRRSADPDTTDVPAAPAPGRARRTVGAILAAHEREERAQDGPVDFDDFDDDSGMIPYYMPEKKRQVMPSAMDPALAKEAQSGVTMMIPMDTKGRRKKQRYYVPDEEQEQARRHASTDETLETREDIPVRGQDD